MQKAYEKCFSIFKFLGKKCAQQSLSHTPSCIEGESGKEKGDVISGRTCQNYFNLR